MPNNIKTYIKRYLTCFFSVALFISGCSDVDTDRETEIQSDDRGAVLLISIDGLMTEYMERNETPNLDWIARRGVLAESMEMVFPTKTFPTHYSIVTGLYPENHGIISNSFRDYELDALFSYGPPDNGPEDDLWWGGEPIWVTAENQSQTAATMFWPGSDSEIKGVRPTRFKDYDGSIPNLARIDTVLSWLDPSGDVQADFATLYFSDVDSYGHRYGPNSEEVNNMVEETDQWIGYLLERMQETGLEERLNLIIVSDHGMAELSDERLIFLDDLIDMENVDIVDWTPVAMIRPEEGKTQEVYEALKENEQNFTVYLREELPDVYRFREHYRIPDIIMIADLGYTITTHSFYNQRGISAGNHGYDHRLPEMHGFFLAKGPAFLTDEQTGTVRAIHLYELMTYILGLEPAINDGVLDEIRHILNE